MNQIQNNQNCSFLNHEIKDDQSKNQTSADLVTDNMFMEQNTDLSLLMISNDLLNKKAEFLNDIEDEENKNHKSNDIKFINKKRKRRVKSPKKKNDKSMAPELIQYKKKNNNNENINTQFELEYCYKKLNKIISIHSFEKISEILIKMNNNIDMEEDDKENELFKKIKKITSIIKKKQDIILMILRILTKKNDKLFKQDKNIFSEKNIKERDSKCITEYKINKKKKIWIRQEKGEENFVEENEYNKEKENVKEKSQKQVIFKEHYHNDENNIYCFRPKKLMMYSKRCTLYCTDINDCKAKCRVYTYSKEVDFTGNHNHEGISKENFYKKYPSLENKKWHNIQVIVENGKDYLKFQN
jgi:hypothetical protein